MAFFDRLAELEVTCKQYPFSRQDPELGERVGQEVSDLVRQGYNTFWTKAHNKGYDKCEWRLGVLSAFAYTSDLRQTPDELHRRVQALFR